MRSMVEGPCAARSPSTALRAVPLPCKGRGGFAELDPPCLRAHMHSMLIQTETTPNPSTLKFLPGERVMETGTRDFATPEEAEASPLAEAIFSTGDVDGVFF